MLGVRLDDLGQRHARRPARRRSTGCPRGARCRARSRRCPGGRGRSPACAARAWARAAARLTVVVVLPTPPFWLATTMTRVLRRAGQRRRARRSGAHSARCAGRRRGPIGMYAGARLNRPRRCGPVGRAAGRSRRRPSRTVHAMPSCRVSRETASALWITADICGSTRSAGHPRPVDNRRSRFIGQPESSGLARYGHRPPASLSSHRHTCRRAAEGTRDGTHPASADARRSAPRVPPHARSLRRHARPPPRPTSPSWPARAARAGQGKGPARRRSIGATAREVTTSNPISNPAAVQRPRPARDGRLTLDSPILTQRGPETWSDAAMAPPNSRECRGARIASTIPGRPARCRRRTPCCPAGSGR